MHPTAIPRHVLSKSTFMRGCQCPKSLWLHKHHPELKNPLDSSQEAIFTQGTNAGLIARELFPGGIDASPETPYEYQKSVQHTARLIAEGQSIIYEAAFQFEGVLAAIDILERREGKWFAYEVKSSTSVKDPYLRDAALQYHVLTNSGIRLEDIFIIYINNQYIRRGALDPGQLFAHESVKVEAIAQQHTIREQIKAFKDLLSLQDMWAMDIGAHCDDPYPCDFSSHCWQHIPEASVFDLRGRGGFDLALDLYKKGILLINDIPPDHPVGHAQRVQVEVSRTGNPIINKEEIRNFLRQLVYPLYFVDFETFNDAVPGHDGCWPYQQIPFQFSLHIIHSAAELSLPREQVEHHCFLAELGTDPRVPFINTLGENLGKTGSIVVYNQSFENSRLNDLSKTFPELRKKIEAIQDRMVDLMTPFRQKHYYLPSMKGSYSIKEVLPALVPDLSYAALSINNGGTASQAFCQLQFEKDPNKLKEIRQQLLDYCEMDTWAMVRIMKLLNKF